MKTDLIELELGEERRRLRGTIPGMGKRPIMTEPNEIDIEDPELLAELDAAMEEAERGEGTDAFEFLRQLRDGTWRDEADLDKAIAKADAGNDHSPRVCENDGDEA